MQACAQEPVTLTETDRELARRLASGDARAIDAFYRAHFDAVYEYAWYRVGGWTADAEDVTSETFLLAIRTIRSWEGRAPLVAWLRGIARNKCRERRKLLARRRVISGSAMEGAGLEGLADLDAADIPQRLLESEEVSATVSAALSQLPGHYRRVLVSKYVDGRTFAEIASEQDSSAKAVESLVQRAKRAFARVLTVMTRRPGVGQTRAFHG
jgi:RNA polymerase sigma-70 factor, ECF subfamily